MIHALLVEDHTLLRRAVRRLLENSGDIQVIAEAADGQQALQYLRRLRPDILILDINIPRKDGFAVLEVLRRALSPPKVIVLSAHEAPDFKAKALAAGASAFVSKRTAPTHLLPAIRAALNA